MRRNPKDPFVDLIIRDRGTDDHPALTVEVVSTFDEAFKDALKELPRGARAWDEVSGVWRVHPDYLLNVQELAKKYYRQACLIVGDQRTDLHTGNVYAQGRMF